MVEKARKSPFYAEGLHFSCTRCSACCRHESGYVFLSEMDAFLLAAAMNMEREEFTETFCHWVPSEGGTERLSLKEKPNFDCVFWGSEGCSVYETRPLQCRAFPFWSSVLKSKKNWEFTAEGCPGIGKGTLVSFDLIENWLTLRQNQPIIFRST